MCARALRSRQRAVSLGYVLWPCVLAGILSGCAEQPVMEASDAAAFCGVETPIACDVSESEAAVADSQAASAASAVPTAVSLTSSPATGDSVQTGDSSLTAASSSGEDSLASGGSSSGGGSPEAGFGSPESGGNGPGEEPSGSAGLASQLGVDPRELDALLTRLAAAIAAGRNLGSGSGQPSDAPTIVLARQATKADRLVKAGSTVILTSEDGTNSGGGSGNGKAARVIPDGSDDDIIARRLRRAAELERDPIMKQKLWQEYLSYRQSAHAP
jgi:hypothetical protein